MGGLATFRYRVNYHRQRLGKYQNLIITANEHRNFVSQFIDVIHHKLRINTSPIDYYRFGFYMKDKSWEEKERYVGKRGSTYFPYAMNSVEHIPLVDNKYIFKTLIKGFGLPQPDLFFSIGKNYQVKDLENFESALSEVDSGVVLKPVDGSCGEGIVILDRHEKKFFLSGKPIDLGQVWDMISRGKKPYIAEQKVVQHPQYRDLNPTSLNTYRIIIIKLGPDKFHVARTSMRIGKADKDVDNLAQGGISLAVNSDGISFFSYDWGDGREITKHPETGVPLIGHKMALFDEVVATALAASRNFVFLGTAGWDIGVSESGPMIIEGNVFYDCAYNQYGPLGPLITSEIKEHFPRYQIYHRWDKTRIHPKVNRYRIRA